MPLEAQLEKKKTRLFGRLSKSWLSKSRLVQRKKKLPAASEPPGLSLSTKAISSNRELLLLQSHLDVPCTEQDLHVTPNPATMTTMVKGGPWAPLMDQNLDTWPYLLEGKLRNVALSLAAM